MTLTNSSFKPQFILGNYPPPMMEHPCQSPLYIRRMKNRPLQSQFIEADPDPQITNLTKFCIVLGLVSFVVSLYKN